MVVHPPRSPGGFAPSGREKTHCNSLSPIPQSERSASYAGRTLGIGVSETLPMPNGTPSATSYPPDCMLKMANDEFLYCQDCDNVPCDCNDQPVHPKFSRQIVDPEDQRGFNPVAWSQVVQAERPIRLDPISGALWSYFEGAWREDRSAVADILPMKMGKLYRRPKHLGTVTDRVRAELKHFGRFIYPDQHSDRYVSLPSGLFDFTTGEVVPHDPDALTTYQLAVEPEFCLPTPEFDRFLSEVLHPGDRDRVQDILAYLLRPGNPQQRAVLFTGSGRNGKSVLLGLIESIAGVRNMAAVPLQRLGTRFAAARLYGKAINLVGEIDGGHVDNTSAFKQMTGGDPVDMDVKNAQAFTAHVWAVPVFSANQIPTSADTSDGYLRRWEIVEFPNTFDGSNTTIADRLRAERAAIAGKLLRRAAAVAFTIRPSEPGGQAKATFAKRSDPVRAWLAETDLSGFVSRTDAYCSYREWIEDGNGRTPLTKTKFYDRVSALRGEPRKSGVLGWDFCPDSAQTAQPCPTFAQPISEYIRRSEDRHAEGWAKWAVSDDSLHICRADDEHLPDPFAAVPSEARG